METNYAVHPGALIHDNLVNLGMSQKELSQQTGISTTIINELIKGKRSMNAGIAQKLESVFDLPATFWMAVQAKFDLTAKNSESLLQYGPQNELQDLHYTANQVADRLISYNEQHTNSEGYENNMTNLRLQKMLFFMQKEFVHTGKILFDDEIVHWEYGPVIKTVYHRFKNTRTPIQGSEQSTPLTEEHEKLLRKAFDKYNKYTTSYLVTLTHKEKAWLNTDTNEIITPEMIREYM